MITVAEVLERARSTVGVGCRYHLGAGGMHPEWETPWGLGVPECDCSGAVAWWFAVSRKTDHPYYREQNGGWLETSALTRDARSTRGFVDQVPWDLARAGDLLVYGDRTEGGVRKQGHVGLVSLAGHGGPLQVIHCSSGNDRLFHDAIQETDLQPFWVSRGALVARPGPEWVEAAA